MADELPDNVPSAGSDIDELNDETFGSGAVDDDWELAHSAMAAGKGEPLLMSDVTQQSASSGRGIPPFDDELHAVPTVNGNGSNAIGEEEVLPSVSQLNIQELWPTSPRQVGGGQVAKIKELWPTSPRQGSPLGSIWSSPELGRPPSDSPRSSPHIPPGSRVMRVEDVERELSSTPPPLHAPPHPTHASSPPPPLLMRGPPPPHHHRPHMMPPPPHGIPWMGGRGPLPPPPVHLLPRHLLPHFRMASARGPPPGMPPLPHMAPPHGLPLPPHIHPHRPHPPPPEAMSHHQYQYPPPPNRRTRRSEFLNEMKADGSGFMTQREKDWVIKIQLLQLQSADPANDDYYYQHYIQKKLSRVEKSVNSEEEGSTVLSLPQVSRGERHYKPAEFQGALGKLSVSSISAPRKTIEIPLSGGPEGGEEGGGGPHTPSRDAYAKKRQTLMMIEKIYSLVLTLEEVERKALALPEEDRQMILVQRDALCKEVAQLLRLKNIDEPKEKGDDLVFQQVMSYRKGRRVMRRVLALLPEASAQSLVLAIMRTLNSAIRKDVTDQVLPELLVGIKAVVFGAGLPLVNKCLSDFLVGGASHSSLSKVMLSEFGSSLVHVMVRRGSEVAAASQTQEDTHALERWTELTQQLYTSLVPMKANLQKSSSSILEALSDLPHIPEQHS